MLVPFISRALSVGFCFFILGTLGALVPDLPGVPVNDLLNRSLPIAMCGETVVAMLPDDVAPAVAAESVVAVDISSVDAVVEDDNVEAMSEVVLSEDVAVVSAPAVW